MILAALGLASVLSVSTPGVELMPAPSIEWTPNLYPKPAPDCAGIQRRVRQDQRLAFEKLGKLPPGHIEYAVLRQVGGCAVPAPIGYHPPSLPGAADVAPPPVTREGAPSNRR